MSEKVKPVTKQLKRLILLEKGIEPRVWTDFVREVDNGGDSLVLAEKSSDLSYLKNPSVKIKSVGELVPLSGTLDGELWSDACSLVDTWISQAPLCEYSQALEYDGISLWEMGRLREIYILYRALKKIEALRIVLSSESWQRIILLMNERTLWAAFQLAAVDVGYTGNLQKLAMQRRSPFYARMYNLIAEGWGDQIVVDIMNGLRPWRFQAYGHKEGGSKPFLFLVNGNGHYFHTLLPIIKQLQTLRKVLVINTGGENCLTQLRENSIPLSYCTQYLPFLSLPGIIKQSSALKALWYKLERDEQFHEIFTYRGRSIWSVLRNPLRKQFCRVFPRMMVWAEALKHIFESVQPYVVVTVPDRHFPARIALARRYGIPSLTVQPALINDGPQYGPMYADKAAVMDDYSRSVFVKRGGVSPDRLVVTGLPRWDDIPKVLSEASKSAVKLAVREKLGLIKPEDKLVTFVTENIGLSLTKRMIKTVQHAMARYPDLHLVIKLHPAESLADYTYWEQDKASDHEPIVVSDVDLHPLLATSELVIGWFSNVVLEAAMLDKDVLVVNLSGEPDPLPFVQNGLAVGAYSEEEVVQQFDRIMTDPSVREQMRTQRHRYMERNPQLTDGKATERVVHLLREMAGG